MTGLTPVSFAKPREHAPRLSPVRVPGRHDKRFWTPDEIAILRECYPIGGATLCLARRPARNRRTIWQQARKLKLGAPTAPAERRQIVPPSDVDDIIRARWPETARRGGLQQLADDLGLPKYWVSKRAAALELTVAYKKEPRWTDAEKELMKRVPLHDLHMCGRIFREHGFARTPTSIGVMARRLNLSRRESRATFSGTAAARLLGLDNKTVTTWCVSGDLKATRRQDKRLPQQGGSSWDITPADLRAWILDNLAHFDIRKVDKVAFLDLWATPVADADQATAFVRELARLTPGAGSAAKRAAAYDALIAQAASIVQAFAGDRRTSENSK
ncbi:MAG: helix-turn-helix domain-containing protein [Rhodoblastus sp.]|nr:helix-turn-helix domain-containing protein [Rhodoblastus sp.]